MKYFCDICHIRILKSKKEVYQCHDCGSNICGKHCFFYVDEANKAITKNSPNLCSDCLSK